MKVTMDDALQIATDLNAVRMDVVETDGKFGFKVGERSPGEPRLSMEGFDSKEEAISIMEATLIGMCQALAERVPGMKLDLAVSQVKARCAALRGSPVPAAAKG